jgi:hypothetical protein
MVQFGDGMLIECLKEEDAVVRGSRNQLWMQGGKRSQVLLLLWLETTLTTIVVVVANTLQEGEQKTRDENLNQMHHWRMDLQL